MEIAVAVEVGDGETAADFGLSEAAAEFGGNFEKFGVALIQEELRGLGVAYIAADVANGVVNVAVGDCEIETAVEVGVEEDAAEAEGVARGGAEACLHGDIVEGFSIGAIEAEHFVVEIGYDDAGFAGVVEIGAIDAHAGAGFAFIAEGEAHFDGDILEFAVAEIAIKLVGLGVVGDEEIRPAVLIEIEHGDAEGFGAGVEDAAGGGDVFEGAVTAIVEEPAGVAAIGFGRAVGFIFSVEAAEDIVVGGPANVIADKEIEEAVAVVIEGGAAGAWGLGEKLTAVGAAVVVEINASLRGDVGKLKSESVRWRRKRKTGGEDSRANGLLDEISSLHGRVTRPLRMA